MRCIRGTRGGSRWRRLRCWMRKTMSDFTSGFWSFFVAGVTLVSIVACGLLLQSLSRRKVASDADTTGHVWDEDLDELNNPLPRWWIGLFWITIVFSLAYLW